ncbi:enolase C-terminal domain-like protein [Zavarzinella formosa]|uniref:enolase C-terminal domain-like protein n=1 Tax=Zavarzinella formosa TaxID=360055 RepID=UPI000317BF72|nr:enolase C-terminal domain-like protein [Zavarzinella formosa]
MSKQTDVRIREVRFEYEDYLYRTPIKFGGVALDRVTLLNAHVTVETFMGTIARGFGSMPMGNVWAYPSKNMTYFQTLDAMKAVTTQLAKMYGEYAEFGHPIDITWALEHQFPAMTAEVGRSIQSADPIPLLATLVCASPFDAALHDAYGKAHRLNCYSTYGPEFLSHDLGHYLGKEFAGEQLENYISPVAQPRMPMYHLVGALDPLTTADVKQPVGDGLPETLAEWIPFNGLTHLKIKLNGDDIGWDVDRVVGVDRVAAEQQAKRGITTWFYSLDFNEKCGNVAYLLEFLRRVKDQTPAGFDRIQYIEQPTKRDLKADRANTMHEAAKLRPVVIDESLLDLESLRLAKEMGYTGAALKACKGQTQSLLMGAAAKKDGLFLCVQDLTCVGASIIHSAGLAAHIPGIVAIESNGRQYCPVANKPWEDKFPGMFKITDGTMQTGLLDGVGLGAIV